MIVMIVTDDLSTCAYFPGAYRFVVVIAFSIRCSGFKSPSSGYVKTPEILISEFIQIKFSGRLGLSSVKRRPKTIDNVSHY